MQTDIFLNFETRHRLILKFYEKKINNQIEIKRRRVFFSINFLLKTSRDQIFIFFAIYKTSFLMDHRRFQK